MEIKHGEGYLRLSYANSLPNLKAALERMEAFLEKSPARAGSAALKMDGSGR